MERICIDTLHWLFYEHPSKGGRFSCLHKEQTTVLDKILQKEYAFVIERRGAPDRRGHG